MEKYILQNELNRKYYKDLFFCKKGWKNSEDMDKFIRRLDVIACIFFLLGSAMLVCRYFIHDTSIDIETFGRDAWSLVFISIMAFYMCIDAVIVRCYWKCYQNTWKQKKCYDADTRKKRFLKNIAWIYNFPLIGIILFLKKILVKSHMDILFSYGEDVLFSSALALCLSPTIVVFISTFIINFIEVMIPVKMFANLVVFSTPVP